MRRTKNENLTFRVRTVASFLIIILSIGQTALPARLTGGRVQERQPKKIVVGKLKGQVYGNVRGGRFVPDGQLVLSYENGQVALRGNYRDGKPEGLWTRWYPNGAKFGTYRYTDGEIDGEVFQYWQNGDVARAAFYRRGAPTGQTLMFSPQRKLLRRAYHFRGKSGRAGNLRYRFLCRGLDRSAAMRCKSLQEIERDLKTFLTPGDIDTLLEVIDRFYDDFGLDDKADALVSCGSNRVAAFTSSSTLTASNTTDRGQNPTQLTGVVETPFADLVSTTGTRGLAQSARAACAESGIGARPPASGIGGSGLSDPGRAAVNNAVKTVEQALDSCQESRMGQLVGGHVSNSQWDVYGAGSGPPGGVLIAILAAVGVVVAEKIAEKVFDAATDDGYAEDGLPLGGGKTKYPHKTNPEDYKIVDELNNKTEFHTKNELGGETVTTRYEEGFTKEEWVKKDASGKVVETGRRYDSTEGDVTETTTRKEDGSTVTTKYVGGKPKSVVERDKNGKITSTRDLGEGAGQPAGPDQVSRCEQARAAWAKFKQSCEMAKWQTYKCVQFVRRVNRCVDPARILPTPDGDMTCDQRSEKEREEATRAACERKKGIMIVMPGGRNVCDKPDQAVNLEVDVCNDPHAMCRPDAALQAAVAGDAPPER